MNSLKRWGVVASAASIGALGVIAVGAVASANSGTNNQPFTVTERLSGYHENPLALSTTGSGSVRLTVDPAAKTLTYTLRYANLAGTVTQAHIHFGSPSQVGGVSVFLCSNLGNGPAGTPTCPTTNPGVVTRTVTAAEVIGPASQGIAPGEFAGLVKAIRADSTYANVHSDKYPIGEIRSQLTPHDH